ncbi:hypothetical protein [Hymenobacter jeollabukensis]|uniref:Uncharacterized protein n=1 Tax=Hymenobacter jeollabukensis TaxID=2025313 RepID=A0A5R8WUH4_9BACT|nr:hypothetical protein [Hymenobacter jeollabukensis]TLM95377.1 hypothetical protein FDY95_06195 [Hymenobacter jeollabukensis]
MRDFRTQLATLLLLCFVRVLLPESAILALHRHAHTEKEEARLPAHHGDKAVLSTKHQHCPVDHLYDVPFQPAAELVGPTAFYTYARPEGEARQSVWAATAPAPAWLRGPPARA